MMRVIVGQPPQKISKENGLEAYSAGLGAEAARGPFRKKISEGAEDIEWEKITIEELLAMATTQSLMGDLQTFRLRGALTGARAEEFLDVAKELVASVHTFVFLEEKLLKKPTDALKKAGAEVVVYPSAKKEEPFNMFAVTYAFAARDRKKLWLLLHAALRAGAVPEAIAGMLHWKVRDMLGKGEAGKYTKEELKRISRELVCLYHESHRGAGDLALLLERYVVGL